MIFADVGIPDWLRPLAKASDTKSIDHSWLGLVKTGMPIRSLASRFRSRRRTDSPAS